MSVKRMIKRVRKNKPLRRFYLEPAVKDSPWVLYRVMGNTGKLKGAINLRTNDKFQFTRWRDVAAYIVSKSMDNDPQVAMSVLEVMA